jgi:hypothetical protein
MNLASALGGNPWRAGRWLRARARGCSRDFGLLEDVLAGGVVNHSAQLTAVMNGAADGTISVGPLLKLR